MRCFVCDRRKADAACLMEMLGWCVLIFWCIYLVDRYFSRTGESTLETMLTGAFVGGAVGAILGLPALRRAVRPSKHDGGTR
jgi:uncharacterized membrane protein YsdA (DUF1294 family)